ncbi:MAG: hypothetical protein ACI840_001497 [Ulvibacter sp.]|jgi:hypothetical protein
MKKITVLVVAILISASGFSQSIDLGIKAGANFANISDVEGGDAKSITGFQAGVFVGFKLGDKIGLQADVLYSQQGSKISDVQFDLTYVNVPIVLKYYIFQGLNIQAGPQFGINIKDNLSETVAAGLVKPKSIDISGVVGVGYDLPMGLRVEGRYNLGLTEILEPTGQTASVPGKNTVISLALGYSFL